MRHLSLATLTLVELEPPAMISAAAEAGYQGVSLTAGGPLIPAALRSSAPGYALVGNPALRRETVKRANDTGIKLDLMEGFVVSADFTADACRETMDVTEEMGVKHLAGLNIDTDPVRMRENLSAMCEMATKRGLVINIEFMPLLPPVVSLKETVALINEGRYPGLTIMVDVLHLIQSGGTAADVAQVAHLVTGAQFSDGPRTAVSNEAYMHAAMHERDVPGDGEFPLKELFQAMPEQAIVYLEVPKKSFEALGLTPAQRAKRILDGMRRVEAAI